MDGWAFIGLMLIDHGVAGVLSGFYELGLTLGRFISVSYLCLPSLGAVLRYRLDIRRLGGPNEVLRGDLETAKLTDEFVLLAYYFRPYWM